MWNADVSMQAVERISDVWRKKAPNKEGINGTWRAGGVNAGEAAGSVSEGRGLFPGATDKEGGGS